MAAINFLEKRVLIIEDQSEMRVQLKSMLERLGVPRIDSVVNGEEAIDALRLRAYDIVFSDFELGRGKDGQQVLEEIRYSNLIKETSSFILVTAAQTVEMVMGAMEYHPDGYITKPVTFEDLRNRIERILKTKLIYKNINQAIDDGELEKALEACNRLAAERPKLALPIYRIKGRLLLELERIDEAELLYDTVLGIRETPWVLLGMAKVRYFQKKFDQATQILEALTETHQRDVSSLDWLAKIQEAQGKYVEAQKTLELAVGRSPKAILRQRELSRIAVHNEDWTVAVQATRRTVSLGKNSCYKNPKNYLTLAEVLQTQLLSGGVRDRRYVSTEIFKTLESLRSEFPENLPLHIESSILASETYNKLGRTDDARQSAQSAMQLLENNALDIDHALLLRVGKSIVEASDLSGTKVFLESEFTNKYLNEEEKASLTAHANKIEEERVQEQIDKFNNKGVSFFEKGALAEAIQMFEQASEYATASHSVLLNAVQAHIMYMQKNGPDIPGKARCKDYFQRLSEMQDSDRRFARMNKLKSMYDDIIK